MKRGIETRDRASLSNKKRKIESNLLIIPGLPNGIGVRILRFLSLPFQSVMAATSAINSKEMEHTYASLNRQYPFLAQLHQPQKSLVENTILAIQQAPMRFKKELEFLLSQKSNVLHWAQLNPECTEEQVEGLVLLYDKAFKMTLELVSIRLDYRDALGTSHWQKYQECDALLDSLNSAISDAELYLEDGDMDRGGVKLSLFGITRLTSDFLLSQQEQLKEVTELALQDNLLQKLPKEVNLFSALEVLNLTNNKLKFLPSEIGELTGLDELWINHNELQTLPSEFAKLESLSILSLRGNCFKKIPEVLCTLVTLTKLSLAMNELESVPVSIGRLINLDELNLDYNLLSYLPEEVGLLKGLDVLTLSNNALESLPQALRQLINLSELNIDDNSFSVLPSVLCELPELVELSLANNPWRNLSKMALNMINDGTLFAKETLNAFFMEVEEHQSMSTYLPTFTNGFMDQAYSRVMNFEPYEGLEQVIAPFQPKPR